MLCSDGALTQAAQKLWGLLLGDLPEPPGYGPDQPALGVPARAGAGAEGPRGPASLSRTEGRGRTVIAELPGRSAPRRLCPPRPPLGPAAVSGGTLYGSASLPRLGPALPAAMQSRVLCLSGGAGAPAARRVRLLLRQVLAGGPAAARPGRLEVRSLHGSGNHPPPPHVPGSRRPSPRAGRGAAGLLRACEQGAAPQCSAPSRGEPRRLLVAP